MKVIKFRAWDVQHKEMMPCVGFVEYQEGNLTVFTSGATSTTYIMKDWILQQFTGLKDKNGKEIYEGDIVEKIIHRTCWKEPDKTIIVVGSEDCPFIDSAWLNKQDRDDDYYDGSTIEVIGNIYKNPELLEEKKE